jgi:hypothetical protein
MIASVGNYISSWLTWPTEESSLNSPAQQLQQQQLTPLHPTMRDPTASASSLKRAAPVEEGLMPEQFYTLNPEFLTDVEKWSYKDLQRLAKQLGVPGGGKGSRKQLEERLQEFNRENEQALGAHTFYAHSLWWLAYAAQYRGVETVGKQETCACAASKRQRRIRRGGRSKRRTSIWCR